MKIKSFLLSLVMVSVAGYLLYTKTDILHSAKSLFVNIAFAQDAEEKKEKEEPKEGEKAVVEEEDDRSPEEIAADEAKKKAEETEKIKLMFDGIEAKRLRNKKAEEKLNVKIAKFETLKAELDEKLEKLDEVHRQIKVSLEKFNKKESEKELLKKQKEERKLGQLVKVYTSMKPKQAGAIINKLDILIAEKLFLRMKGEVAGRILSYVDSEKAAKISERLAESDTAIGN
ncbi:MAG: hypothetical protein GY714_08935 [Desulfobacterales bacterium]|nr:hypothetical protein [Desulfobacterales bacterium]